MDEATQLILTPAQKIIKFIAEETGLQEEQINLTSRLRQDLGIDADQADDLLELYSLSFDVDISRVRVNDYFGEGSSLPPVIGYVLWLFGNSRPLKDITVADLTRALETHKL